MGYSVPTIALEIAHQYISIILASYFDIACRWLINALQWEVWSWPKLSQPSSLVDREEKSWPANKCWYNYSHQISRHNGTDGSILAAMLSSKKKISEKLQSVVCSLPSQRPRPTLNFSSNLKSWSFWKIRQYRVSKQHQVKFQSRSRKLMTTDLLDTLPPSRSPWSRNSKFYLLPCQTTSPDCPSLFSSLYKPLCIMSRSRCEALSLLVVRI